MPPKKYASDFVLTAFELANDDPAKVTFLKTLTAAVYARPNLAKTGFPTALAAATDECKDVRRAAFDALDAILTKRPLLAQPADMQMIARAYIREPELDEEIPGPLASGAVDAAWRGNPGWPDAVLPIFIEAIGNPDATVRGVAYEHFSQIVVRHPERAESLLPVIKATMGDADADVRMKALIDADSVMKKRPELADDDLLMRVAKISANDEEPGHRDEAADILNEFAKKHPRRVDDLLPNRRLLQLTARLQVIAGR
jgi:hypothetical protein